MADENDFDDEELEEEEPKKKSKLKMILIIVVGLAVLGGGGFFGYSKFFKGGGDEKEKEKTSVTAELPPEENVAFGTIFPLDLFVVNLSDRGGKRYLKTKIELEFVDNKKAEVAQELNMRLPQLRDVVLLTLSSKNLEEIQGVDGKIALRNELIMRINQVLRMGKIRNLYYTEFVVQ